jgi:hypothetical protein
MQHGNVNVKLAKDTPFNKSELLLSMTVYIQAETASVCVHAQYQQRACEDELQDSKCRQVESAWRQAGEGLFTSQLSVPLNLPASEPCLFGPSYRRGESPQKAN